MQCKCTKTNTSVLLQSLNNSAFSSATTFCRTCRRSRSARAPLMYCVRVRPADPQTIMDVYKRAFPELGGYITENGEASLRSVLF